MQWNGMLTMAWFGQDILDDTERKYSDGPGMFKYLAENKVKHHRVKGIEERMSEETHEETKAVIAAHELLHNLHSAAAEAGRPMTEGNYPQWTMEDYLVHYDRVANAMLSVKAENATDALSKAVEDGKTVTEREKARVEMQTAAPTFPAQLNVGYFDRGRHYHENGWTAAKKRQSWAPIFQGVSCLCDLL